MTSPNPTPGPDSAESIVSTWITQPPWMLAELRRRLVLRARFYKMRRAIWEGKL